MQKLTPRDYVQRREFIELEVDDDDVTFFNNIWVPDKAHFHLNVYFNKQNFRCWAQGNSRELHDSPLYKTRVTLWCVVSRHGVIGPYFFEYEYSIATAVTSARYIDMIETFLHRDFTILILKLKIFGFIRTEPYHILLDNRWKPFDSYLEGVSS